MGKRNEKSDGIKKEHTGYKWLMTTVVMAVVPFGIMYLYKSFTCGKFLPIGDYFNDFVLIVASIAYGLCFAVFYEKKIRSKLVKFVMCGLSGIIWILGLGFYFYNVNAENKLTDVIYIVICIFCVITCIVTGVIFGEKCDTIEIANYINRREQCKKIYSHAATTNSMEIIKAVDENICYCEVKDVDLVELLKNNRVSEKKTDIEKVQGNNSIKNKIVHFIKEMKK